MFTIFIPAGTPLGSYTGFFQILGGSDPGSLGAISNVVEFQIDVPEPDVRLLLLGSGIVGLAGLFRHKLLTI